MVDLLLPCHPNLILLYINIYATWEHKFGNRGLQNVLVILEGPLPCSIGSGDLWSSLSECHWVAHFPCQKLCGQGLWGIWVQTQNLLPLVSMFLSLRRTQNHEFYWSLGYHLPSGWDLHLRYTLSPWAELLCSSLLVFHQCMLSPSCLDLYLSLSCIPGDVID